MVTATGMATEVGRISGMVAEEHDGATPLTRQTASSVADTVRTGLEKALADLRQALLESKSKLTSSPGR